MTDDSILEVNEILKKFTNLPKDVILADWLQSVSENLNPVTKFQREILTKINDQMKKNVIRSRIPSIEIAENRDLHKSLPKLKKLRDLSFGLTAEVQIIQRWIEVCEKFSLIEEIRSRKTIFNRKELAEAILNNTNPISVIENLRSDIPEFLSLAKVLEIDVNIVLSSLSEEILKNPRNLESALECFAEGSKNLSIFADCLADKIEQCSHCSMSYDIFFIIKKLFPESLNRISQASKIEFIGQFWSEIENTPISDETTLNYLFQKIKQLKNFSQNIKFPAGSQKRFEKVESILEFIRSLDFNLFS